ncbi:CHRD domain-containing protein [Leptolyngbyaceae cyanobacterium JSC-12]|nr:CHRD domain-containing protein [Leptolyngbyaceae cyanobacterium JSC-12]
MTKTKRTLLNCFLGVMTCLLLIGTSNPSFTKPVSQPIVVPGQQVQEIMPQDWSLDWLAQGMMMDGTTNRYQAVLSSQNVVPNAPSTMATGKVKAMLKGDRLMVQGSFANLSSPLRDYVTDPVDPPNPRITSAAHIHQGEPSQNGPFQYALTVKLDRSGMGGKLSGTYMLTGEQRQALFAGKLYVDIHTQKNRAGELRGILQPS